MKGPSSEISADLVPLSVIVCTLNEEANIGNCLRSVGWASQRFVVDADSTDRTAAIGRSLGATVISHPWRGYSDQKNWALDNLPIEHDWILCLDADEVVPPPLAGEIRGIVADSPPRYAGYYVARRLIFMGRWLKHCWWYPDYTLRLFKREAGRFEKRLVHERLVLRG
ncbi:MAG: glycosyltransferase family 2 protein [Chloroflexi bacterium]|nr:glycosyltransferase family 2 protein [Chloroflexota bacterium]